MTRRGGWSLIVLSLALHPARALAHSGPPYPAISARTTGAYIVTVWTDPDTTDDGSAQGKFWVTLQAVKGQKAVAGETRVDVSVRATDRQPATPATVRAEPVKNDPSTFYAALPMDHEGPYAVHVAIDSPAGHAALDCEVQATYDLRPSRFLLILYVAPFLVVGFLWAKLLVARRRAKRPTGSPAASRRFDA